MVQTASFWGKIIDRSHDKQLTFPWFEEEPPAPEKRAVSAHTRTPSTAKGKEALVLPADIPVRTVILDIPEEEKVCKETGIALVQIGVEKTQKLAHEPGCYYIKEILRPKYAHPQRSENGILTASLPESAFPKCRADESLLAEIITAKFADHTPLYRVEERMSRSQITISRKLLSQWILRCGEVLKPLYERMLTTLLSSNNVFIDESPVKLQEKVKCKTGYMWVVVGGNEANPPHRVYVFSQDRRHHHATDILKNYHGILHSDKFEAYQKMAEKKSITWAPCWAHVRRKFFEAETRDLPFRDWVLRKIRYLFLLEKIAWARSPEERVQIRQEKESPIIDELIANIKDRMHQGALLPKSKFREALGYFCGLIPYLKNYTQHPFARLDNNVAERAIRPLTIGRKNWLFFGSEEGGEAGAILLSLVQTCRGLGINPREYLEDVLRKIMGYNFSKLHELLPDQWLLQQSSIQKINLA